MNYASEQLFMQILNCFISLIAFIIPALLILLPVRFLTKVPSFVFRKLLHIVGFTCVSIMLLNAKSWLAPVICYILIAVLLYPVLAFLEHAPWFEKLFVQKTPGEIKRSLLLLFFMCAALVTVSWGIFGQPHLASSAILMWGTGDAAAALVGIPYGRHKVRTRFTDGKKSWEGSFAMLLVSFLSGVTILLLAQRMAFPRVVFAAAIAALLGTVTELISPSEYDTITVPVVILTVLLLLV